MTVVHDKIIAGEHVVKLVITDLVMGNVDAHIVQDLVHVVFADERVIDLEAASVAESLVQVILTD